MVTVNDDRSASPSWGEDSRANTGNGSQPRQRLLGSVISRRGRLLIAGIAALVMAAVLVAPVVLRTGSVTMHAKRCAQPLRSQSRE